jgi:hypothetical protein
MGRTESKQVVNQGTSQSAQDQQNAQTALANTNSAVTGAVEANKNFLNFGRKAYGANGEYAGTLNTQATGAAAAGGHAMEADLALRKMRTGENSAGYAAAVGSERRGAAQDLTQTLAAGDQDRLSKLTAIEQQGVDNAKYPAAVYGSLYGSSTGASGTQLEAAGGAARTPGFWDTFAPALAQGAGAAIAGACPCAGSMIRMADGSEKSVEEIRKGDFVWSLSTSSAPNQVMKTPEPVLADCSRIKSTSGREHRASDTHTIALAIGGYAHMPEMLGMVAMADLGTELVSEVASIGKQLVYPIELNGSHTYMADGFWILS